MGQRINRVARILNILRMISTAPCTARQLAQANKVDMRTIFRDIRDLEQFGFPSWHDPVKQGYVLRQEYFLPPIQLTLEEALVLGALAEHVGGKERIPFLKEASAAIAKINTGLPAQLRDQLAGLQSRMDIRLAAAAEDDAADVYGKMRIALARKVRLRCAYESAPQKRRREFYFHPYALFFEQRAWYAVGYHEEHDEIRCLKLNRFEKVEITSQPYSIPRDFTLQSHMGYAWRMIRGKKRYDVELRFDPSFAETISSTRWHCTQETETHDDGSMTFRCKVDGLDEIVWWVLSMGPHCVVRKPRQLAWRVRDLAQKMLNNYPVSKSADPMMAG